MKLEKIYAKDINREVNPAVNASNLSQQTVAIEIGEYVFTDDIINNLYKVLSAIKDRTYSHNGMWISGYFGSGKSHFLKYIKYCLDPRFCELAIQRLKEAVMERDPLQVPDSHSEVTVADCNELASWLNYAKVDAILFNIGSVHNIQGAHDRVFLDVFWNEFNRMRGYNSNNLALAQYFEKVLDEKGKFYEFKQYIAEMGFNWEDDCISLATTELDMVLDAGKELVPSLSTDIIRDKIASDTISLSVETFVAELKNHISRQDDNYRIVFLVDEISQFIDNRSGLLLQLQQIVSDINQPCEGKAWVACTAQQDLSEIVSSCQINQTSDDYGKIMGRFQVQVSLKGTSTEYITQRRILEKTADASLTLNNLYTQKKNAIEAQFNLPAGYRIFADADDFINYYPFVPYQFTLMGNIFDSFVAIEFVNREVKGNERSIIKVTHSTAKDTKEQEVGDFISFDQFYNAMFSQGLSNKGTKAVAPAENVARAYQKPDFALRVVHVLFMLCYMSEQHRMAFSASADNITTLIMQDIDCQKLTLKNDVQNVLDYLIANNIIRKETRGTIEVYSFYSEDEREVASTIKSQTVDSDSRATVVTNIYKEYLAPSNRENFCNTSFNVAVSIMDKMLYGGSADIKVNFVFESQVDDVNQYAFTNGRDGLIFYMADLYRESGDLKNIFHWYCQVEKYLRIQTQSETRSRTNAEFRAQANALYRDKIVPRFREMFDKGVIISDGNIVESITIKGKERYRAAVQRHLGDVYPSASLVTSSVFPTTTDALRQKINRPIDANEYGPLNPINEAEKAVKNYIDRQGGVDVVLTDVVATFLKRPYGWSDLATIYVVNELVRRRIYEFAYNNNTNVDRNVVAANIVREKSKFTIKPARAISQELVNSFTAAWKDIFNVQTVPGGTDAIEIYNACKEMLAQKMRNEQQLLSDISAYPFAESLQRVVAKLTEWQAVRDYSTFFQKVVTDHAEAKALMDESKVIREFCDDQLNAYKDCCQFARENEANWEDLDSEAKSAADMFKKILADKTPMRTMPAYRQKLRLLRAKLDEVRNRLREEIRTAYRETEEQIINFAAEQGVAYTSNIENIILTKTQSQSIANLKLNRNTDDYYATQTGRILSAANTAPEPTPNPNGGGSIPTPPTASTPMVKNVRLSTRSTSKLTTSQDVDNYLAGLRAQLMRHIDNGEEILVM